MKNSYIDSLQKHYVKKENMSPEEALEKAATSWEVYYKTNKQKIEAKQKKEFDLFTESTEKEFSNLRVHSIEEQEIIKPRIYIDLDGVLADYQKHMDSMLAKGMNKFQIFKMTGIFDKLEPINGAVKTFHFLTKHFEVYILSTPLWSNPDSWSGKRIWVEKFLGKECKKKLILSHNKGLLKGDYLIDDRTANGVLDFEGEHIHFGTTEFQNWELVLKYICTKHHIPLQ